MALPKLSAQQPIVNPDGKPSSPFLQFMEKARTDQEATDAAQDEFAEDLAQAIEDIEAAMAAAQAADAKAVIADDKAEAAQTDADTALTLATDASNDAAQAELTVDGLIAGTTPFVVLNVGGATIADSGGLADDIVTTSAIAANNVSQSASAFTEANLAWSGSGYNVAQTASLTTTGGVVDIDWGIIFDAGSATGLEALLRIERDGVIIWGPYSVAEAAYNGASFSMKATIGLRVQDQPAAGAHTWELLFSYSGAGGARNVRSRSLAVREEKTET